MESLQYNNYWIEYNIYGQGEYTVFYNGEDVWFDTVSEARKFIDSLEEEE